MQQLVIICTIKRLRVLVPPSAFGESSPDYLPLVTRYQESALNKPSASGMLAEIVNQLTTPLGSMSFKNVYIVDDGESGVLFQYYKFGTENVTVNDASVDAYIIVCIPKEQDIGINDVWVMVVVVVMFMT